MRRLSILAAALVSIPRIAPAYGSYGLTPLLIVQPLPTAGVVALIASTGLISAFVTAQFESVSVTALLIQIVLVMPFFIAMFAVRLNKRVVDPIYLIRALNAIFMMGGLLNFFSLGFPFRLPYIHFLPDYYWGFFGLGGAKIGTVIGFFGIVCELVWRRKNGSYRHKNYFLAIAGVNFLLPNFLLGIFAGFAGLGFLLLRRPKLALAAMLPVILLIGYASFRVDTIEDSFTRTMGSHPKIYQVIIVGEVFADIPHSTVVGVGPGQFGGQAAMWPSPAGDLISSRDRPNLPGFFSSSVHLNYLAPVLLRFRNNIWAISSSANKPYSSVSIILVEHGTAIFLLILVLSIRHYLLDNRDFRLEKFAVFTFIWLMLGLDTQHDMPWFGLCIIIFNSLIYNRRGV